MTRSENSRMEREIRKLISLLHGEKEVGRDPVLRVVSAMDTASLSISQSSGKTQSLGLSL